MGGSISKSSFHRSIQYSFKFSKVPTVSNSIDQPVTRYQIQILSINKRNSNKLYTMKLQDTRNQIKKTISSLTIDHMPDPTTPTRFQHNSMAKGTIFEEISWISRDQNERIGEKEGYLLLCYYTLSSLFAITLYFFPSPLSPAPAPAYSDLVADLQWDGVPLSL